MADQKTPGQPGSQQNPQRDRESAAQRGEQNPQKDRESASRQPGQQTPGQRQEPKEKASQIEEDDAARRQSRQDPLQNRDR